MEKIILDTNFLMIPVQFNVDIYSEIDRLFPGSHRLFTLDKCVREINGLIARGGKEKKQASLGLQLYLHFNVQVLETKHAKNADDALVKLAQEGYRIATMDAVLRKRIRAAHGLLLTMRQKKYLILD